MSGAASLLCGAIPGEVNKCLLTPDREPSTEQSNDTIKDRFGKPMSLMDLLIHVDIRGWLTGSQTSQKQMS